LVALFAAAAMLASDPTHAPGRMNAQDLIPCTVRCGGGRPGFGTSGSAASTTSTTDPGPCGTVTAAPTYTHVIWILMENHGFGDIIGNTAQAPYINMVAAECGLATNYHNVSHPSCRTTSPSPPG
jgi:hypothetical protein